MKKNSKKKLIALSLVVALGFVAINKAVFHPELPKKLFVKSITGNQEAEIKNFVRLKGEVDSEMVKKFRQDVDNFLKEPTGGMFVFIDSPGGRAKDGIEIIEVLMTLESFGIPSVCIVDGNAYSMAFNILSFCTFRLATSESKLLFHSLAAGIEGNERFTSEVLRDIADSMEQQEAVFKERIMSLLNLSDEEYHQICKDEKEWSPQELFDKGYLNDIVKVSVLK